MSRTEDLRALSQRVADALPPEVLEVVLTGSVSRGVADEISDVEMLLVPVEHVDLLAAARIEEAALRWGGYSPAGILHPRAPGRSAGAGRVAGGRGSADAADRLCSEPCLGADD